MQDKCKSSWSQVKFADQEGASSECVAQRLGKELLVDGANLVPAGKNPS